MKKTTRIIATLVVIGLIAVGVGLYFFFRDDAPPEANLDDALAGLEDAQDDEDSAPVVSNFDGDIAGTWTIDNQTGNFTFEEATGTFVGFRIEEELRSVGSTTAVGRTNAVTGSMEIEGTSVIATDIEIDLTQITTNNSRRDDNVQDALETDEFPTATFTLTEPIELGEGAADGEQVTATATGDMTIHGVTQEVTFDLEAKLADGVVVAVGSTTIDFPDFGVEVPQGGPVIQVDEFGVLELQLLLIK